MAAQHHYEEPAGGSALRAMSRGGQSRFFSYMLGCWALAAALVVWAFDAQEGPDDASRSEDVETGSLAGDGDPFISSHPFAFAALVTALTCCCCCCCCKMLQGFNDDEGCDCDECGLFDVDERHGATSEQRQRRFL